MRAALLALAGAAGAVALVAVLVGVARAQEGDGGGDLLPDLIAKVPSELELTRAGARWRLGFASASSNVGAGPLIVQGRRRPGAATMATVQIVKRQDGSVRERSGAGRLRYVVSPDHAHWHFVPFMRYELRPAGGGRRVRDRKTGFCLGDRYAEELPLPGKPQNPVYTSRCGLRSPTWLGVREGISVGYGDDYDPTLEGQYVDVTGLPAGRYVLTHRVNETGALEESRVDNNASSLLVRLRWRAGRPAVEQLRPCPGSDTC